MKKLKKLYKKNKVMFILTSIAIACILIIIIGLFMSFYNKNGTSKYGDRLDGIENVKITDKFKKSLVDFYEDDENVKSASVDVSGKIIYIVIDVNSGVKVADAQSIASKGLEEFSDDELEFYDLQFILTSSDEKDSKTYPTMGYKNNSNSKIVWINRNA